ncbi:MAG: hypothetical protein WCS77_04930 [Elusimicrobiaceae bacterium]|jgi:antitoxin component YwqK of YwqJK toxin-antitoxin module
MEREYYESGALKKEIPCENGKIHGTLRVYRESGELEQEISYRSGHPDGVATFYYPGGAKQREIFFAGGQILSSAEYNPDGTPDETGKHLKNAADL